MENGKFIAIGEIKHTYNPLEEADIASTIANLKLDTTDMLHFFKEYGLFGGLVEEEKIRDVQYWNSVPHIKAFKEEVYINALTSISHIKEAFHEATVSSKDELSISKRHENFLDKELTRMIDEANQMENPDYFYQNEYVIPNGVKAKSKEYIAKKIRGKSTFLQSITSN
ncbi:hypothetical protein [Metabacillus bambusae]|uniref:Uncharacterized protein n=1 Tax=Metabacillus bambusae TaxID=2795218 RepID=A0ABS3NBK5_9BACI|nr:hypothetical protein [Metabacillus bambusae]MBO1515669.1 hypothetical protein [Metabacillus bambusae]